MPRYIFPASTVTNTTGAAVPLAFYATSATGRRETDLWTVDGSSNLLERIPNGIILADVTTGAYSAFAGPDDVDTLYLSVNGGARTTITATTLVTGQGGTYLNGTFAKTWTSPTASATLTGTLAAWVITAVDCTAGAGARTLPAANSVTAGTSVCAKKADTSANNLVVSRAGSDLIYGTGSGSTSKTLSLSGEAVEFVSNGVDKWTIRASDTPSGALASTYARPLPNTIVLLGDSITNYNGGPSLAAPTAFWDSKGFFAWGNILLGGRLKCLNDAGITGDSTAQMLARITTDVLAFSPGWVHVMGGRNDDGVTAGQLTADTIANLTAIIAACRNSGARVVISTILPGPTTDTASKKQHDNDVNRWIRDYCRTSPGLVLNDMGSAVCDVTTNWRSLASLTVADRVHPNSPGAALMGKQFATVMNPLVPANGLLPTGTGTENFLANPYITGSGTTAPTSWSVSGSPTMSYVARTDNVQGSWFQAVIANGGTASNMTQNASLTGALAVGASCYLVVEVQCDTLDTAPSANTQFFGAYLQCYNGSTFTTKAYAAYWDSGYVNVPFPGAAGVFVTAAAVIPAATTLVQAVITMNGGGAYRIGRAALRVGTP